MSVMLGPQANSRTSASRPGFFAPKSTLQSLNRVVLPSAYVVCVAFYLLKFSASWQNDGGFTSSINFGSKFHDRSLDELKRIPHAIQTDSCGYDGQFYAQLALSPTLDNLQLPRAIDNVSYRSRRILFSWTAWLMGLGRPAWVIQAFALQNVLFWLGAALILLRWLPPTRWFHFFQWVAILFSRGWVESVDRALLDGPALSLMLFAFWWSERGRPYWGSALLGVSLLGKETNLLAGLALLPTLRLTRRGLKDLVIQAGLLVLPIGLWLVFIYFRFGLGDSAGSDRNFSTPFGGWCVKVEELRANLAGSNQRFANAVTVLCMISTIAQIAYFATVRQWSGKWWRMGAPYALLGICLGAAVMEGYPGAYTRVLLPMLAAFNLSLKQTKGGWLLLAIGNLGVVPGLYPRGLASVLACWR